MKNTEKTPEILLVTRPLTPPWDEASKNFAYLLATKLDQYKFHILVGEYDENLPKHITQHVIYKGASWTTLQKTKLVLKLYLLLKKNPGINTVHFLFAPTPFNTRVLKNLVRSFPIKVIQTIASVPRNARDKIASALFANQIVVYSKHAKKELLGARGGSSLENKLSVIPPFIDFSQFKFPSQKERMAIRKKWKIQESDKIILFPGEYSRLGAIEILLKSFIKIKQNIPEAKLYLACRIKKKEDYKIEHQFKKEISSLGLSSSVNFLGKVENIRELYVASDLTVFPAKFMEGKSLEGKFDFPFVLLESLTCGTQIITSDLAALPEIWEGNKEYLKNYVYPAEKPGVFLTKSIKILEQDRKMYAKELSTFVNNRFNQAKILERYSELYNSLVI